MRVDPTSEARAALAEALNLEVEHVAADARTTSLPGWDSISHVRLVILLEGRLGRALEPEEVLAINSVDAIARLLATL